MKSFILLINYIFLLGFQENDHPLIGLWILQGDSFVNPRTLIHIKEDSLYFIRIGDLDIGDYNKLVVEGGKYEFIQKESALILEKDTLVVQYWSDSLTLKIPDYNDINIFRRLKQELANLEIEQKYLSGSFVMRGENYVDSLDFINDSLLIHTGEYNMNYPADKWSFVNYAGYNFLNIHNIIFPLTILKSCSADKIILDIPYHENYELTLEPSKSFLKPSDLIGKWTEIYDSTKTPLPVPPGFDDWEPLYELDIDEDSIRIQKFRRDFKLKWALTNDGKRIYFPDRVLKNDGS